MQSAFELKRLVKQTILQIVHTKREPTMQEGQETPIRSHIRSRSSTLHQEKPRIHRTRETRWSSRDSLPYAQKERTKPHAFRLILPSRPRLLQNDSFSARSIQFPSGGRISRTGHTVKSATRIVRPPSDALNGFPAHSPSMWHTWVGSSGADEVSQSQVIQDDPVDKFLNLFLHRD